MKKENQPVGTGYATVAMQLAFEGPVVCGLWSVVCGCQSGPCEVLIIFSPEAHQLMADTRAKAALGLSQKANA